MAFTNIVNTVQESTFFKTLEEKTNINRKNLLIGMVLSIIPIYFIIGISLITNIVGFTYPSYMSYKSLKSTENKDDKQWLIYWIVFSFINLIETLFYHILYFIPFYHHAKLVFFVWLYHDSTKGAEFIFKNYLQDNIEKYEKKIDENIDNISSKLDETKDTITDAINSNIAAKLYDSVNSEIEENLLNNSSSVSFEEEELSNDNEGSFSLDDDNNLNNSEMDKKYL